MHARPVLLIAALCLLFSAGCASRAPQSGPNATPGTSTNTTPQERPMAGIVTTAANPPASELMSPRHETWKFDSSPDPAPSSTPMYRLNEITFDFNSTGFNPEGNGVCRDTATELRKTNGKVLLLGYAHWGEPGGERLGYRRAERVRECFKAHGLNANRFELSTFGSRYSVADIASPVGMEQERRVEVWVISE